MLGNSFPFHKNYQNQLTIAVPANNVSQRKKHHGCWKFDRQLARKQSLMTGVYIIRFRRLLFPLAPAQETITLHRLANVE